MIEQAMFEAVGVLPVQYKPTHSLEQAGYTTMSPLLSTETCDELAARLASTHDGNAGTRNLLDQAWCANLARQLHNHPLLHGLLPATHVATQCTYFEKSADHNWLVPLHQDLSIAVAEKVAHPVLSGWSEKEGVIFVQPPVEVLQALLAVRLHIDHCGEADGPLRVVPGSHLAGRLDAEAARQLRDAQGEQICPVEQGGALLLRPLLLHASSKSKGQSRRRVLHFLFGPADLPLGLRWHRAIA